jgi:Leucine-rich repeat (LRR) protein
MHALLHAGLDNLPGLNTLVAKQNHISSLSLAGCSALHKLSMAHNALSELGDALSACTGLKELRLNHNRLERLPPDLAANAQLRIVDLGDNPISRTGALKVPLLLSYAAWTV